MRRDRRPTWLGWLHGRHLSRHRLRSLLAACSLAAGAAIVVAVGVEAASITRATAEIPSGLAGPAVARVVGPTARAGLSNETVRAVEASPGVGATVPVVTALTRLVDRSGGEHAVVVVGCTPDIEITGLECPASGAVSVSPGLATLFPGGTLRTNSGSLELVSVEADPRLGRFAGADVVMIPLGEAQRVFLRGDRVDVLYLIPDGTSLPTEDIRSRLGTRGLLLRADEPAPGPDVAAALLPLFGLVGLFAMVAGGLLVFSVTQISLAERRTTIAIEEAIGASPAQVMFGVVAETAVLGAAGGALGSVTGIGLAMMLLDGVSDLLQDIAGVRAPLVVPLTTPVLAVLVSILVAATAGWAAARRMTREDIAHRLATASEGPPRRPSPARWVVMIVPAAGGVVLCLAASRGGGLASWQPPVSIAGLLAALVGLLGLAGRLSVVLLRQVRRFVPFGGGAVRLGARGAHVAALRTPTTCLVVAVVVALGGALLGIANASRSEFGSIERGDLLVTSLDSLETAALDAQVPPTAVSALVDVLGDERVARSSTFTVARALDDIVAVTASDPGALPDRSSVAGASAQAALQRGDSVVASGLARRLDLRPGDELRLPAPGGEVTLRVGAIWDDLEGGGQALTMDFDHAAAIWGGQPVQQVVLVDGARSAGAVRAALKGMPDLSIQDAAGVSDDIDRSFTRYLSPLWGLQRGLLAIAIIAVGTATYLSGYQRRQELGVLSSVGAQPGKVVRLLVSEGAASAAASAATGLLAVPALLVCVREASLFFLGARLSVRADWPGSAAQAGVVVLLAALAASLPAVVTSRWDTSRVLGADRE